MLDRQITNQTLSQDIIPGSRLFPHSTLSNITEESNDWNLRQILGLLKRRAVIIAGIVTVGMTGITYSTLNQQSVYQGNFQILVEPVNDDSDVGKLLIDPNISRGSGLDYESQIQVLKSSELLKPIIKQLQVSYPDITYTSLLEDLTIRRFGTAKVIQVSYNSHDTEKIKFVLDTISQFYLNYSLDKRQTKLRQGIQFVEKQLPDIKNRVAQLQKEMQVFRQRYNFIDPENQAATVSEQIQSLTQQRLAINQQLTTARANYLSLQGQSGRLTAINNAPIYQQLITQQRQLDTQLSGELARFKPDNPIIQSLQEKRNNLLPLIEAEASRALNIKIAEAVTQIRKIEVDSKQLAETEQQLQNKLKQLPVLSRQYTDIQRNLQLANESFNRFLASREQLQIEVAQTELPWELIQRPNQPEYPISPNIPQNLLLGFVASFLLGLGAAVLMEEVDNTYHTIDSIKDKIKLPILGTLPFDKTITNNYVNPTNKTNDQGVNYAEIDKLTNLFRRQFPRNSRNSYYSQGAFWESLQVLYSNIQLLNSDQPINSLIVSSSVPGDGKSTVAYNLAKIASTMGKRVLLVDTDLRRPQVHKLLELNNLWGLSNLISSNMDVKQVIQEIPTINNLSVVTSGPIPPDPGRLLSSEKMRQLMEYFHQSFDLVIYDSPPILGLVDVRFIA
ncbi:polysaccharide biosynthesis tyrosine autokinase, partial [Cuspidothrix issatschenkoi LEGE 03284]|uniref:GumC family protein n=1 Tax=Cuspidothrix issatschenkoi TaxID=230752 RepID=UPI001882B4CB